MKFLISAAALITCASASQAQTIDLTDLWMACDLAQVDAGGDAPMASSIDEVALIEIPGQSPSLRILATAEDGEALFCDMTVRVGTFRYGSETIIGD